MKPQTRESWQQQAQEFELDWWKQYSDPNGPTPIPGGAEQCSRMILERFGFTVQEQFDGMTVLDVGCGPTGRLSWFKGGEFVGLDPLASKYAALPWARMERYEFIHSSPAEDRIPGLVNRFDYLFSINALDHCFDLYSTLSNLYDYMKPAGGAFFSVDCDKDSESENDPTHPLAFTNEEFRYALQQNGFTIVKVESGRCLFGDQWRDSWGGGTAYHWWLSK